jgi:hypothetical protein
MPTWHVMTRLGRLDRSTPEAYIETILTVVETTLFQRQWPLYWTEDERAEFAAYIAENPTAGDAIPKSGGFGKSGGNGRDQANRAVYGSSISSGMFKVKWCC